MKSKWIAAMAAVVMMLTLTSTASAQLFGNRTVGGSLSRRPRPTAGSRTTTGSRTTSAAAATGVGALQGNERFLRGMRRSTDFVGSDSRDRRAFVGSQQATTSGTVVAATSGLQSDSGPDANQGQAKTAPPRVGMYDPRLRIDFHFTAESPSSLSVALTDRMRACCGIRQSSPIVVSVEGGTATVRGEVAGERDRRLAELMLLFEPGISQVDNELTVAHTPRTAAARLRVDRMERPTIQRSAAGRSTGDHSSPREF